MNGTNAAIVIIAALVITGGAYMLTRPHDAMMQNDAMQMHDDSMQNDSMHDDMSSSTDTMDAGMQMEASGTMMVQ